MFVCGVCGCGGNVLCLRLVDRLQLAAVSWPAHSLNSVAVGLSRVCGLCTGVRMWRRWWWCRPANQCAVAAKLVCCLSLWPWSSWQGVAWFWTSSAAFGTWTRWRMVREGQGVLIPAVTPVADQAVAGTVCVLKSHLLMSFTGIIDCGGINTCTECARPGLQGPWAVPFSLLLLVGSC